MGRQRGTLEGQLVIAHVLPLRVFSLVSAYKNIWKSYEKKGQELLNYYKAQVSVIWRRGSGTSVLYVCLEVGGIHSVKGSSNNQDISQTTLTMADFKADLILIQT